MYRKRQFYLGLLISLLLILIVSIVSNRSLPNTLQIEYNGEELYLFYQDNTKTYQSEEPLQINHYYNDKTSEYCLFLPSYLENIPCNLLLYGAEDLVVDQQFYQNQTNADFLTQGRHSVAIDGTFYVFNINFGSEIESIFIETSSQNSINFLNGSKEHIESGEIKIVSLNGTVSYSDKLLSINSRGNASWLFFPKKSYSFLISDKAALTESGVTDEWILLSNASDNSNMRNKLAFDLGQKVKLSSSFSTAYIDLYIDGEYIGLYLLAPKIAISDASVNIHNLYKKTKQLNSMPLNSYRPKTIYTSNNTRRSFDIPLNPKDITGGYLMEQEIKERYSVEPCGFITNSGQAITVKSPKYASTDQVNYICTYFQEMETALMSPDGICPETLKHYFEYIDMDSWIKKYLVDEITKNYDMGKSSSFFYKPSGQDSKIFAGPLWDYDGAFAYWDGDFSVPHGLIAEKYYNDGVGTQYFYYAYQKKEFYDKLVSTFRKEFLPILKEYCTTTIDDYQTLISHSAAMDSLRWNKATDWRTSSTFEEEVLKVKSFLAERTVYLESIW